MALAFDLGAHVGAVHPAGRRGASANSLGHPIDPNDTIPHRDRCSAFGVGLFPRAGSGSRSKSAIATTSYRGRLGVAAPDDQPRTARGAPRRGWPVRAARPRRRRRPDHAQQRPGTSKVGSLGGLHYGAAFTIETRPGLGPDRGSPRDHGRAGRGICALFGAPDRAVHPARPSRSLEVIGCIVKCPVCRQRPAEVGVLCEECRDDLSSPIRISQEQIQLARHRARRMAALIDLWGRPHRLDPRTLDRPPGRGQRSRDPRAERVAQPCRARARRRRLDDAATSAPRTARSSTTS